MGSPNKEQSKAFIVSVARDWAKAFEDLAWKARPLVIAVDKPVRTIRLELQEEECFHLHSMSIYERGPQGEYAEPICLDDCDIQLSSCYVDTPKLGDGRLFLNNDGSGFGFHTARQINPWIEITLPRVVHTSAITLLNRNDEFSVRARTLKVSIGIDALSFGIYDALDRHRSMHTWVLQRHFDMFGDMPSGETATFVEFLRMLAFADFYGCTNLINANPNLTQLRTEINIIAKYYAREFTTHGIHRSFRFWDNHEKHNYLVHSQSVLQALREISEHTCYGFGFALGYVRDGDFIAHDDDVDIIIAFDIAVIPNLSRALRFVEEHLCAKGFLVSGNFFSHRWVSTPAGAGSLDVFVGLIEADGSLSFYPARRRCYKAADVFPPQDVVFLKQSLPMPKNLPIYLQNTYGENWRQADNAFSHAWDEDSYSDIR